MSEMITDMTAAIPTPELCQDAAVRNALCENNILLCAGCGNPFALARPWQTSCSPACLQKVWRLKHPDREVRNTGKQALLDQARRRIRNRIAFNQAEHRGDHQRPVLGDMRFPAPANATAPRKLPLLQTEHHDSVAALTETTEDGFIEIDWFNEQVAGKKILDYSQRRLCAHCGVGFIPWSRKHQYCNKRCASAAARAGKKGNHETYVQ
jgi:hypothetical protein